MYVYYTQRAKTRKKVHFGRTMHCLPQSLKSTLFEKNLSGQGEQGVKIIFQKLFILVFEVIMHPPNQTHI